MSRLSSTAVMARRVEPAASLDFFPTPPWATRALCRHVLPVVDPDDHLFHLPVWDPCCGEGHMALALGDTFDTVHASDILDYGGNKVADFLHDDFRWKPANWIVMNPPFNHALEFVQKALDLAYRGVAMLARTSIVEGEGRHRDLYSVHPPMMIAQYVERVPMHRGRWVVNGTTASSYCWLLWMKAWGKPIIGDTRFMWIPKSRRVLERHDDWLRFRGCVDIPEKHPARMLQREGYWDGSGDRRAEAEPAQAALFGG